MKKPKPNPLRPRPIAPPPQWLLSSPLFQRREPDFAGFLRVLPERGRMFLDTLKRYPAGIDQTQFMKELGCPTPRHFGSYTGQLISLARHYAVRQPDVYYWREPDNRIRVFYPGPLLMADQLVGDGKMYTRESRRPDTNARTPGPSMNARGAVSGR